MNLNKNQMTKLTIQNQITKSIQRVHHIQVPKSKLVHIVNKQCIKNKRNTKKKRIHN